MKFFKMILLSLSLCATTALAHPFYYTASGYVTNRFQQPLSGMYMCVRGPFNTPAYPTVQCAYTNYSGFYAIAYPYTGTYLISAQGYGVNYSQYVFLNFDTYLNFVF